jgi:hypothetical protein
MTPLTSIDAATFERMNIWSVIEKSMLWESVKLLENEMLSVSFHRCRSGEKSPKFRYKIWGFQIKARQWRESGMGIQLNLELSRAPFAS